MNFSKIHFPFYFGTSILLIDDDRDYLDSLSLLLQSTVNNIEIGDNSYNLQNIKSSCRVLFDAFSTLLTDYVQSQDCERGESGVKVALDRLKMIFAVCRTFPSVIISDYDMPRMNGVDFLAQIKDVPVKKILLTGAADATTAVDAFNRGIIDAYIKKNDEDLFENLSVKIHDMRERFYNKLLDPYRRWQPKIFQDIANDKMFISFFSEICHQHSVHSYYYSGEPFGFILIDDQDRRHALLLRGQTHIQNSLKNLSHGISEAEKTMLNDCRNFPAEEVIFSHAEEQHNYVKGMYVPGFSNLSYLLIEDVDVDNVPQHYPFYAKSLWKNV